MWKLWPVSKRKRQKRRKESQDSQRRVHPEEPSGSSAHRNMVISLKVRRRSFLRSRKTIPVTDPKSYHRDVNMSTYHRDDCTSVFHAAIFMITKFEN